jgi:hypothetical protein
MLLVDAPLLLLKANDCHKRWATAMPALRCIVLCLDVAARGDRPEVRAGWAPCIAAADDSQGSSKPARCFTIPACAPNGSCN